MSSPLRSMSSGIMSYTKFIAISDSKMQLFYNKCVTKSGQEATRQSLLITSHPARVSNSSFLRGCTKHHTIAPNTKFASLVSFKGLISPPSEPPGEIMSFGVSPVNYSDSEHIVY